MTETLVGLAFPNQVVLSCADLTLVLAYMGLPLQIFGKVFIFALLIFVSGVRALKSLPGKHVWALHPSAAAGSTSRRWHEVICSGINELLAPATKGSL